MRTRRTFTFPVTEKTISISAISADLQVAVNDTNQLMLEVELEGNEDKIKAYAPKVRRTEQELEVELEYWDIPKVLLLKPRREPKIISVIISMPSADAINLSTVAGDISAAGFSSAGSVTASTVSGDVALTAVKAGSVSVKSAAGDLAVTEIKAAASLRASAISGDIAGERVSFANGTFETVSGDIKLSNLEPRFKLLELKTVSGDVAVTSPSMPPARIEYSSLTGQVRVGGHTFKGSQGNWSTSANPTALIKISTVSGMVTIESQMQESFDPRAEAIIELLRNGKLTRDQAQEMLTILGYSAPEINKLLQDIE